MKLILLVTFSFLASTCNAAFCHWNSGCPYKYFSTKTSYNAIRGDIRDSIVKSKGCEPTSIWGLFRYGKRYPSFENGKKMEDALAIRDYVVASYKKGHCSLCAQDIEDLTNWPVDTKMFDGGRQLTSEGYEEMLGIGKRLKQSFPKVLENLEKDSYIFRPANDHWIEDSCEAFIKGFETRNLHAEKAIKQSDIMAPHLHCDRYQKDVKNNPKVAVEIEKYMNTPEYLAAKDRIQRRTGIDFVLSDTNVTALYDLCRYTWSGMASQLSPWCAIFTKDDLQVLEYIEDLKSFYKNGYGMEYSEIFGRIPLLDLFKTFVSAKEQGGKKITAYFTDSAMLDMVYTTLGLFKDHKPLSANRDRERKWRSSANSAFSVNLVAVLNRCTKNDVTDYSVVFYLNEEPIGSICADGICTWKEFENRLSPFVNTTLDFC